MKFRSLVPIAIMALVVLIAHSRAQANWPYPDGSCAQGHKLTSAGTCIRASDSESSHGGACFEPGRCTAAATPESCWQWYRESAHPNGIYCYDSKKYKVCGGNICGRNELCGDNVCIPPGWKPQRAAAPAGKVLIKYPVNYWGDGPPALPDGYQQPYGQVAPRHWYWAEANLVKVYASPGFAPMIDRSGLKKPRESVGAREAPRVAEADCSEWSDQGNGIMERLCTSGPRAHRHCERYDGRQITRTNCR